MKIKNLNSFLEKILIIYEEEMVILKLIKKQKRLIIQNFTNTDQIKLVKNGLAFIFREGWLSTSSGTEKGNIKHLGSVNTILRLLTQKIGDLSTYFDMIDESEAGINKSSLKHMPIHSHSN